jgi:hypothetical protein
MPKIKTITTVAVINSTGIIKRHHSLLVGKGPEEGGNIRRIIKRNTTRMPTQIHQDGGKIRF